MLDVTNEQLDMICNEARKLAQFGHHSIEECIGIVFNQLHIFHNAGITAEECEQIKQRCLERTGKYIA